MPFSPALARRIGTLAAGALLLVSGSAPSAPSAHAASEDACRASAARVDAPPLVASEPTVANAAATPCASDRREVAGTVPAGPLSVTAPHAATQSQPGVIAASASVEGASLALGGLPITVGAVETEQTVSCTDGTTTATGSSHVDALTIAGTAVPLVAGRSLDLNLGIVRVRTNLLTGDVRQALVLDVGASQVVLGEARAAGDACASLADGDGDGGTTASGGGSGDGSDGRTGTGGGTGADGGAAAAAAARRICPKGSTYRVKDNVCIISDNNGSDGDVTIVGAPYAGPSGGTVLSLETALGLVKAGKLPDSACLHGNGADYVVMGTTAGRDRLTGTNGGDRILGLGGNDEIGSGRGADCVDGGTGIDSLTGGDGNDHLLGARGNDHLNGGPGTDVLEGGDGNDTINTSYGADRVFGGAGRDAINAATAGPAALIDGGSGRDIVRINVNERRRLKRAETVHTLR